jgi:F420-dependent oxidoreductase-like protein
VYRRPEREQTVRFAIKTAPQNTTWEEILAVFKEADQVELFESGWLFDHFYPIRGDSSGPCLEGWTALAALAQATARLRLGVLVTGIHYRHPAVLANMAATLDIISGGRLELGIGAGWNEEETGAYGMQLGSLRDRSDRFEEACQVLIGLLSRESTDFAGEFYHLTNARCEPKGVQRPHPPICIGGGGEKRTLRTTALYAQHWNFVGGTREEFAHKRDVLYAHCEQVGRDPKEITLSSHIRLHTGSAEELARAAEEIAAFEQEGLNLAIVILPMPYTPAVLGPLVEALAPLA